MAGRRKKLHKNKSAADDAKSKEYLEKRNKNNDAVKKSREKAKLKEAEIRRGIARKEQENARLQKQVEIGKKVKECFSSILVAAAGKIAVEDFSPSLSKKIEDVLEDDDTNDLKESRLKTLEQILKNLEKPLKSAKM